MFQWFCVLWKISEIFCFNDFVSSGITLKYFLQINCQTFFFSMILYSGNQFWDILFVSMTFVFSKLILKCFTCFNVFMFSRIILKHSNYFSDFFSFTKMMRYFTYSNDFVSYNIILKYFISFNDFMSFKMTSCLLD